MALKLFKNLLVMHYQKKLKKELNLSYYSGKCFCSYDNVHDVLKVINLIHDDGIFVNESHYLKSF